MPVDTDFNRLPGRVKKALSSALADVSAVERLWWSDRVAGLRVIDSVAATADRLYIVKSTVDQFWSLAVTSYGFEDITSVRANFKRFKSASEVYVTTAGNEAPKEVVSLRPLKQMSHEVRRLADPHVIRLSQRAVAEDLVQYLDSRAGGAGEEPAVKTCPDCAEEIRAEARICRFCGYRYEQSI